MKELNCPRSGRVCNPSTCGYGVDVGYRIKCAEVLQGECANLISAEIKRNLAIARMKALIEGKL